MNRFCLNLSQASDMVSTSRILVAVVQMCYEAKDWDALNENIMLLTKRRSQLKQVSALFTVIAAFFITLPISYLWPPQLRRRIKKMNIF